MSSREERSVELTVISAQDLKKVKTFGKQESFVTAYSDSRMKRTTKVDKEGDLNPAWNSKLNLLVDEAIIQGKRGSITLEIHCQGAFGSKLVGTSYLHLSDLSLKEGSDAQFMSLEVRRPSGKAKGLINVSIALGEKRTIQQGGYQAPRMTSGQGSNPSPKLTPPPVTAYPAAGASYNPQPSYGGYPPQALPHQGYAQQGYPQQGYSQQGYPQQGYVPPPGPYGYVPPPQPYGYPQQGYYQQPPRRSGFGGGGLGGAGMGLGAGLLGGLLVGDAIGNMGDNDTYIDNNYYGDSGGGGDYDGGGGDFDGGGDL